MGRLTEMMDYINQPYKPQADDRLKYTRIDLEDPAYERIRKERNVRKKAAAVIAEMETEMLWETRDRTD